MTQDKVGRYECLNRRIACSNQRLEVLFDTVRTEDGVTVSDFMIVRPRIRTADNVGGVCILPEVDGKIGLMRVYRHQLNEEVWQAPAGFVEVNEAPADTALRELQEETSVRCVPDRVESLGLYLPDAGLIDGYVALFVARESVLSSDHSGTNREIGVGGLHFFDRTALKRLVMSSADVGGSTLVACLRVLSGS